MRCDAQACVLFGLWKFVRFIIQVHVPTSHHTGGNLITSMPTHPQRDIVKQILRDSYDSLYRIMICGQLDITGSLYSRYFVDEETRSFVTSATGVSDQAKAHKLVENCTQSILIDQHPVEKLKEMLNILRNALPAARPVADKILEKVSVALFFI